MRVVIIGAFTHLEWDKEEGENHQNGFWNCALTRNGRMINIIDYYKENHSSLSGRHVYNTGIVLFNYFHQKGCNTHLINCLADITSEDMEQLTLADVTVISTVYSGYGDAIQNIRDAVSTLKRYNKSSVMVVGGWTIYNIKKSRTSKQLKNIVSEWERSGADILVFSRQGVDALWEKLNEGFRGVLFDDADNSLPAPQMYSVEHLSEKYHSSHTAVITATGCPFDCTFCEYKKLYNRVTYYSLEEVKRLLQTLASHRLNKLKHVRFGDECLNYPYNRMMAICRFLSEADFGFSWGGFLRLGNIDEPLVYEMKKSNCSFASIGMESGDSRIRSIMNKQYADEELEKTIALLKKYDIKTIVSLVVGYYEENEATIEKTKAALERIKPDLVRINIWQPYPNEEKTQIGMDHHLSISGGVWKHDSMDIASANTWASYLYQETKGVLFTPPFTSIFDIWPWLVGEGLHENQIMDLIRSYYHETLLPKRDRQQAAQTLMNSDY